MSRRTCIALIALFAAIPGRSPAQSRGDWEVVPTLDPGLQPVIRDVLTLAADDVWVVGDYFDGSEILPFSLHWDGASWTDLAVPLPNDMGSGSLYAIDASGPDDVWAGGGFEVSAPDGYFGTHVYVLRWDGTGWEVMDTPVASGGSGDHVLGIAALAADDVWFVGEGPPIPAQPQPSLAMHWDGSDFEIVATPSVNTYTGTFGRGNGLHAISALAPDDLWAVGAAGDGDPIRTDSQILHWDGADWTHVPGPVVGIWHSLDAVVAIAPDDVWAGGESFDGVDYHGLALHWDGSTWTEVATPSGLYGLVAVASDDVYGCGAGILHWDGSGWSIVESFPQLIGPALAGLDLVPGTTSDLWAGGRQLDASWAIHPLAVRSGSADGSNYGDGWAGTNGIPSLTANGDPAIGASITVSVGNSRGATTPAVGFVGFAPASLPLADGTLLVQPAFTVGAAIPAAGLDLDYDVPSDPTLDGLSLYVQFLELDPGASRGISFTAGLELFHRAF